MLGTSSISMMQRKEMLSGGTPSPGINRALLNFPMYACTEPNCSKVYESKVLLKYHRWRHTKNHKRGIMGRAIGHIATQLLAAAKKRARKKGGTVTITLQWIKNILSLGRCQGSIPPLQFEIEKASTPFSPSLDRIDSLNRDYTPENTRIVCWCINAMRSNFSDAVVHQASNSLASFMRRRRHSI